MATYKKGSDIKVPFDCLWYNYTRGFRAQQIHNPDFKDKPEGFDKF